MKSIGGWRGAPLAGSCVRHYVRLVFDPRNSQEERTVESTRARVTWVVHHSLRKRNQFLAKGQIEASAKGEGGDFEVLQAILVAQRDFGGRREFVLVLW